MRKEPLSTDSPLDLELEQLIPEASWEEDLLHKTVEAELPNVLDSLSGRSFGVYTSYDANGWFTIDLHASSPDGVGAT